MLCGKNKIELWCLDWYLISTTTLTVAQGVEHYRSSQCRFLDSWLDSVIAVIPNDPYLPNQVIK